MYSRTAGLGMFNKDVSSLFTSSPMIGGQSTGGDLDQVAQSAQHSMSQFFLSSAVSRLHDSDDSCKWPW